MPPAYPEPVLALFRDLPRSGRIAPGAGVGVGQAGSRLGGAEVRVYLAMQGAQVGQARFQAWGCPWTLALAAASVADLEGRSLAELREYQALGPAARLGLPGDRLGLRVVVEDAVRAAARAITADQDGVER